MVVASNGDVAVEVAKQVQHRSVIIAANVGVVDGNCLQRRDCPSQLTLGVDIGFGKHRRDEFPGEPHRVTGTRFRSVVDERRMGKITTSRRERDREGKRECLDLLELNCLKSVVITLVINVFNEDFTEFKRILLLCGFRGKRLLDRLHVCSLLWVCV